MSIFGENLQEIMNSRKLSGNELSKIAGVSQMAVSRLNRSEPTFKTAIKIADALHLSLDYLAGKEVEPNFIPPKEWEINFYDNLVSFLETQNIPKRHLCYALNYSTACFTLWKNGALPLFSTLIEISNYLDCSIDKLIGRSI